MEGGATAILMAAAAVGEAEAVAVVVIEGLVEGHR